jgi:hypothetical protein
MVTVATVCSVSDGGNSGPDRTWLVVTAPPDSVSAEVLDDGGDPLGRLPLEGGAGMIRTPDGAAQVRVTDADGGTLDIVPVIPPPEETFGDYGDD